MGGIINPSFGGCPSYQPTAGHGGLLLLHCGEVERILQWTRLEGGEDYCSLECEWLLVVITCQVERIWWAEKWVRSANFIVQGLVLPTLR